MLVATGWSELYAFAALAPPMLALQLSLYAAFSFRHFQPFSLLRGRCHFIDDYFTPLPLIAAAIIIAFEDCIFHEYAFRHFIFTTDINDESPEGL